MHTVMDMPSQWLGPNHRGVNHDIFSVYLQASTLAFQAALRGENYWIALSQNLIAGLSHVALDEGISAAKRAIGTATAYDQPLKDAQAALARLVGVSPAPAPAPHKKRRKRP
jgi:hypothetical protein